MSIKTGLFKAIAKLYFASNLMFGFYLMSHGHISHGAGFAGGVMIALGFLFAFAMHGKDDASIIVNLANAKLTMLSGGTLFLLVSVLGYLYGKGFMCNFLDLGKPFSIFSAGITAIYNIILCFGTVGCMLYIYLSFFSSDTDKQGK